MTSTSDGSQAEEQAKAFARQYAKEFQAEKEAPINELVKGRAPNFERGEIGQDLNYERIMFVRAIKDIKAGEQCLWNYGYDPALQGY